MAPSIKATLTRYTKIDTIKYSRTRVNMFADRNEGGGHPTACINFGPCVMANSVGQADWEKKKTEWASSCMWAVEGCSPTNMRSFRRR